MREPVLVIHGVANRDEQAFKDKVSDLNKRVGDTWDFIPVYWGDLGADADDDMLGAIPSVRAVRSIDAEDVATSEASIAAWLGDPDRTRGPSASEERDDQEEAIVAAWQERTSDGRPRVRNSGDIPDVEREVRATLQEELPNTRFIKHIHDPVILEKVGHLLGDATSAIAQAEGNGKAGIAVRGPGGTRGFHDRVGAVLKDIDDLVGSTVGNVVGRGNQQLRSKVAPWAARFVGDIIAYTARQELIHERFRKAIADWQAKVGTDIPFGSKEHPVNVIAHSLGGVAAFDMAVLESNPLYIKHFVTFGSQAPFFHAVMPRPGVAPYTRGNPSVLPGSPPRIQSWSNLWEPMDLVAFTAGNVFRLPQKDSTDLIQPTDTQIDTGITDILENAMWTHSTYWESDELVPAIHKAFSAT